MKAKALLLNHGGYDGMKHLTFPIEAVGDYSDNLRYLDVPMNELLRIGYDSVAGNVGELPDGADPLPFMIGWGEAEILEVLE